MKPACTRGGMGRAHEAKPEGKERVGTACEDRYAHTSRKTRTTDSAVPLVKRSRRAYLGAAVQLPGEGAPAG